MGASDIPRFQIPVADFQHGRQIQVRGAVPAPPPGKQAAAKKAIKKAEKPAQPLTAEEISARFQASNPDHRREHLLLRFSETQVDPTYQRGENPAEIRNIVNNYQPMALGTPVLSARLDTETGNYTFWVLDGQQRRAASAIVGYDEPMVFDVHFNLTLAEEAQLFLALNFRKDLTAIGKFNAMLTAEDEVALAIKDILDKLGIKLNDPRGFTAVNKAQAIARRRHGLAQFEWALRTIQGLYDHGQGGVYDNRVLEGFVTFFRHHEGRFTQRELEQKVPKGGDVLALIQAAETMKRVHGGQTGTNIANVLVRLINSHRPRTKRLPFIGLQGTDFRSDDEE